MRDLNLFFLLLIIFFIKIYPQVETIPSDHEVYPFLKEMFIKGVLQNYDDGILPMSKSQVINYLKEIDTHSELLTEQEREFLFRMEVKLNVGDKTPTSLLSQFPREILRSYSTYNEKHLLFYKDSAANFNVDLLGDFTYLYSDEFKDYSILLNIGGQLYGSYSDWLGFLIEGSNGNQYKNRQVAKLDPRVRTSFTFNNTGINFFDFTQGYLRLQKDAVSVQLGRERVLWGNGFINRMILSENPPLFDFLKFSFQYKFLRYDFLHAWLVQPFTTTYIDSLTGNIRQKGSKYLAVSRLGFYPGNRLKFGITQMIIYANRPFEAAYLNPFLFWESAQRSLGDLDNSFLSIDASYKIADGIETSASLILDDILYSALIKGEFDRVDNRSAWQAGIMLTNPLLPDNMALKAEYLQIRPYTFSHPDIGESLTYTNNSFMLGANLQPNSLALSTEISYLFPGNWKFGLTYSHILHGANYYTNTGQLIKNVGGNIFENLTLYDSRTAPLLDGNLEKVDNLSVKVQNEILYGVYLQFILNSSFVHSESVSKSMYSLFSQLRLYFR